MISGQPVIQELTAGGQSQYYRWNILPVPLKKMPGRISSQKSELSR
jgi:hypothetical protein